MTLFRKVGLFLLLGAIVCAAVAGWSLRPGQHDGWVETTGTVIDHRIARDSDGDVRAPVVRFTDRTGADQVVVSSFYSSNWDPVGATVDVRYPPDDPRKAQIGNAGTVFMLLFFGIWAVVLGIIGTVFTVVGRGRRDSPPPSAPGIVEDTSEPAGPLGQWPPAGEPNGGQAGSWPRLPRPDDR